MEKNLHSVDEVFNEAQKGFIEPAPDNGWEKLQANLDKQDADKYKRKFVGWKRMSILLLLLLFSFIIYETGIINPHNENDSNTVSSNQQQERNPPSDLKTKPVNKHNDNEVTGNNLNDTANDLSTQTNRNTKQKNTFTPQTGVTDSFTVLEDENIIAGLQARKYNKAKTKIRIQPGKPVTDEYLETIQNEQSIFPKQEQAGTNNDMNFLEMPGIPVLNKIDLHKIELSPFSPGNIFIKPSPLLNRINTPAVPNLAKKENKKFKSYWAATPFISADWAMYQLDNDVPDNTGNGQDEKTQVNKREKHESSLSTGIMVTKQLSKHIGVKTGIIYSNTAIGISPQEIYAVQENGKISYKYITSSGYGLINPGFGLTPAVGDSLKSAEAQHNLQIISIPLSVAYKLDRKKFSIIPSTGLTANFITSAKVKTEVSDALNKETVNIIGLDGTRQFYAGFMADVNIQYHVDKKLAITVIPAFKYALTPITKNNVVKTFPYGFGIGAGLTYKF